MIINPKIYEVVDNNDEAILYLLAVYHNLKTDLFRGNLPTYVNSLGIFEVDVTADEYNWNIPLYASIELGKDFIEEYRDMFKALDPTKAGDRPTIVKKFRKFFKEYPQYTEEDVLKATRMYLEDFMYQGTDPMYLQNANYFIKKERNPAGSKLLVWLEILKEQ